MPSVLKDFLPEDMETKSQRDNQVALGSPWKMVVKTKEMAVLVGWVDSNGTFNTIYIIPYLWDYNLPHRLIFLMKYIHRGSTTQRSRSQTSVEKSPEQDGGQLLHNVII